MIIIPPPPLPRSKGKYKGANSFGRCMAASFGSLASYLPPWLRRSWLRRSLYDQPGAAFDLDFTDRGAAQIIFDEGQGSLLTDGTRACMEKDHILYDQALDSEGTRGLLITMDNSGVTCGHDAQIAVGHLASWSGYGFGDFEWVARVHHAPDGGRPPANSFSCFSTFVHGGLTHNEMAWCFPPNDGHEVHMAYWFDDTMHRVARRTKPDLSQGYHRYETRWRQNGMDFMIDGQIVHQARHRTLAILTTPLRAPCPAPVPTSRTAPREPLILGPVRGPKV